MGINVALICSTLIAPNPTHIFIGGLGYCGTQIAAAIHAAYPTCQISATVRSNERRDAILSSSSTNCHPSKPWLSVHVLDLDEAYAGLSEDGITDLTRASHIVQTVAPIADFDRDPLLALHGAAIAASSALRYVAYVSSTGVYGDHDGGWVTEEAEMRCSDVKSRARIAAEREWSELEGKGSSSAGGPRVDCFRCGGIYGPGRGPLFSSVQSLDEVLADDDEQHTASPPKYVNRILVDDICGAILASIAGDRPRSGGRVYNLADDDPAPRKAVVAEARRLLAPTSDETSANIVSKAATKNTRRRISRGTGNKRCDNSRLKDDYGWRLKAPTYREGLALLLETSGLNL